MPNDFKGQTVQGKTYDLSEGEGERIWLECLARAGSRVSLLSEGLSVLSEVNVSPGRSVTIPGGYGAGALRPSSPWTT